MGFFSINHNGRTWTYHGEYFTLEEARKIYKKCQPKDVVVSAWDGKEEKYQNGLITYMRYNMYMVLIND